MIPAMPYELTHDLHNFACPMSEISVMKVQRDVDGYIDYNGSWPEDGSLVIAAIECEDGLILFLWEPK